MLSLESNFEETLTRERQKMKEEMVIQTSELEDHIRILAKHVRDAKENLSSFTAGSFIYICCCNRGTDVIYYSES